MEEIKVTLTHTLDLASLKEGGVIVARLTERHPVTEMLRVRDSLIQMLQAQGLDKVGVILCDQETKIEALNEGTMNRMGWFHQPPDFNSPALVEMTVRADGKVAWVNIDGKCALRANAIKELVLLDERDSAKASQDHR